MRNEKCGMRNELDSRDEREVLSSELEAKREGQGSKLRTLQPSDFSLQTASPVMRFRRRASLQLVVGAMVVTKEVKNDHPDEPDQPDKQCPLNCLCHSAPFIDETGIDIS